MSARRLTSHLGALALALSATASHAGTLAYQDINNDADSGISASNTYTTAVSFGVGAAGDVTVNGVTFTGITVDTPTTASAPGLAWSVANGQIQTLAWAINNPATGNLQVLLDTFSYNNGAGAGAQQAFVLDPATLIPGVTYDLRLYLRQFLPGIRVQSFAFTGDGVTTTIASLNEDASVQPQYISHVFKWDGASTAGVVITPADPNAGFHAYALSNQLVAVPEPAVAGLLALGGLAFKRRRT